MPDGNGDDPSVRHGDPGTPQPGDINFCWQGEKPNRRKILLQPARCLARRSVGNNDFRGEGCQLGRQARQAFAQAAPSVLRRHHDRKFNRLRFAYHQL